MSQIGDLIRKRRMELGLSQEQLATQLGLAQNFISKIEKGDRAFPLRAAGTLATILELRTADIVKALQASDPTVPEDVLNALAEVEPRTRPTTRRVNPNPRRIRSITSQGLIDAEGNLTSATEKNPLRSVNLLSEELLASQVVAYQVKDKSFGDSFPQGSVLMGISTIPVIGLRVIVECANEHVFVGELIGITGEGYKIRLFNEDRQKYLVDPSMITGIFKLKRVEL
jgi:transcriptional regulator with XRE-family HTH domain